MIAIHRPTRPQNLLACGLASVLVACGPGNYEVVRIVDAEQIHGRFVSEQAYADYARGAVLEASGDVNGALASYTAALESDGDSAELWTRLGWLRCRLRRPGSEEAFAAAEHLDATYEPLWRARSECELARGRPKSALRFALLAAARDPERVETSILVANLYARLGNYPEAERWFDALAAMQPDSTAVARAIADYARLRGDDARARQAAHALAILEPHQRESDTQALSDPISRDELDESLETADLDKARALSLRARVSPGELALRAVALGRVQLAAEQAGWLLAADSTDSNAWIAALVAADLSRDDAAYAETLGKLTQPASRPTPLGAYLFAELLARHAGVDAARRWLERSGEFEPSDALTRRVAARLARTLGQ